MVVSTGLLTRGLDPESLAADRIINSFRNYCWPFPENMRNGPDRLNSGKILKSSTSVNSPTTFFEYLLHTLVLHGP